MARSPTIVHGQLSPRPLLEGLDERFGLLRLADDHEQRVVAGDGAGDLDNAARSIAMPRMPAWPGRSG